MSSVAVLLSGGLDSAVLVAEEAVRHEVQPIYVSVGLAWEAAERDALGRLLAVAGASARGVGPLVSLSVDMRDVYAATHWAITGRPPAYHTPDEDVYLPGRNIILLGKAGVYCAAAGIGRIVLGTLAHNPFPDATPEFRAAMAQRAVARPRASAANRRAVRGRPQGGAHRPRRRARRAAGADLVVHEPGREAGTAASAASAASATTRFWRREWLTSTEYADSRYVGAEKQGLRSAAPRSSRRRCARAPRGRPIRADRGSHAGRSVRSRSTA